METHECSFCTRRIEIGTGKIFVRRDGSRLFFCSSKCERNMLNLGRVPRTIPWARPSVKEKKEIKKAPKTEKPARRKKSAVTSKKGDEAEKK